MKRLAVALELDFDCNSISFTKNSIIVASSDQRKVECSKVIVTGGGKTYPAYGSDGSIYKVARQLGYAIVEPVPSVVPLVVKDKLCSSLQGQKITAGVKAMVESKAGHRVQGELLFTAYGLSGSVILDISVKIFPLPSIVCTKPTSAVVVDFVPFMQQGKVAGRIEKEAKSRLAEFRDVGREFCQTVSAWPLRIFSTRAIWIQL